MQKDKLNCSAGLKTLSTLLLWLFHYPNPLPVRCNMEGCEADDEKLGREFDEIGNQKSISSVTRLSKAEMTLKFLHTLELSATPSPVLKTLGASASSCSFRLRQWHIICFLVLGVVGHIDLIVLWSLSQYWFQLHLFSRLKRCSALWSKGRGPNQILSEICFCQYFL